MFLVRDQKLGYLVLLFYSTILLVSTCEINLTLKHDFYKQHSTVEHLLQVVKLLY